MKKALFTLASITMIFATAVPLFVPVISYADEVISSSEQEVISEPEIVNENTTVEIVEESTIVTDEPESPDTVADENAVIDSTILDENNTEESIIDETPLETTDEMTNENDEPVSTGFLSVSSSEALIATPPALPLMSCPAQYLSGTIRDFKQDHPNFQVFDKDPANYGSNPTNKMVKSTLGTDGKPEFDLATPFTTNASDFDQWYNDVSGVNLSQNYIITLDDSDNDGIFNFTASPFFPIDAQLWGNEGNTHNQHFTYEVHSTFEYQPDSYITITGDDDVMLFINGTLVTPTMMGIHASKSVTVTLDTVMATTLGLTAGNQYSFDLFYAERNKSYAQLDIETDFIFNDCMSPIAGPTVDLKVDTLDNNTINSGDTSYLTWTSTNATSCTSADFTTGGTTFSMGMGVAVMPTVTKTYTITCTNGAGGTASDIATLTVIVPSTDPSVTLTATPTVITIGDSSVIEWNSANTTSCSSADFTITAGATSGTDTVTPTTTTTYTIECTDGVDTVTTMVTVTVVPVGPSVTITANPTSITTGSSSVLTWESFNTTSCTSVDFTITPGDLSGTVTVTPTTTTTYTIECTDGTDSATAMVTVSVSPVPTGGGGGGGGTGILPQSGFGPGSTTNNIIPAGTPASYTTSSSLECPTIKGYWDLGDRSSVYVTRIQKFLNTFEGEDLEEDGIYGQLTFEAVKRFQTKYSEQILAPWGYTEATGFWYKTTSKMANYLIGCDVTGVTLEDTGHTADDFYTAPDAQLPARYYIGYDQIAYAEFCVMTSDCHNQSHQQFIPQTRYASHSANNENLSNDETVVLETVKTKKCGWLRSLFGGCKVEKEKKEEVKDTETQSTILKEI